MMIHKKLLVLSASLLASTAFATTPTPKEIIIAPKCLLTDLTGSYRTLASTSDFSLISVDELGLEKLIAAKTVKRAEPCGGFMNVTEDWAAYRKSNLRPNSHTFLKKQLTPQQESENSYSIKYEKVVNSLLGKMQPEDMWKDLTKLTSFPDRYSRSDNGVDAANWIKEQVEEMAKTYGRQDVSVKLIATGGYKQPSVVVKIGSSTEAGIVVGGHMDTLSSSFSGKKPGADDDGSGSVTVLETARTLLSSGLTFKKPIYLAWYAAEEMGLVGSKYVVADFISKKIPIDAVMQLDMTGYASNNDPSIYLITDYVNKPLTTFLETLIKTYVKQPIKYTRCGYACSDHASWSTKGFVAAMPFEASFGSDNPNIHSSQDTMAHLSLSHMSDFAKLAVAFAVELAEPMDTSQ